MVNCRWHYTEWFAVLYGIDIDRNFVVYLVCMRKFNPFKTSFGFNSCFCWVELTKFLKNNSISHVPQLLIVLLLHSNPCSMILYALILYDVLCWCYLQTMISSMKMMIPTPLFGKGKQNYHTLRKASFLNADGSRVWESSN